MHPNVMRRAKTISTINYCIRAKQGVPRLPPRAPPKGSSLPNPCGDGAPGVGVIHPSQNINRGRRYGTLIARMTLVKLSVFR